MVSYLTTFLLLIVLLAAGVAETKAQVVPQLKIGLTASPSSPAPGEKVKIQATTPGFDKDTSFFEWTVNGKLRTDLSGRGKHSIELVAGKLGASFSISLKVTSQEDRTASASLKIGVSDLVLSWFADTYTPRWYKGKAMPVAGSVVNIVALPQIVLGGRSVDSKNLIYTWGLDDEERVLTGVGKNILRIKMSNDETQTHWVKVVVEDISKTVRKEGNTFVPSVTPTALIYLYNENSSIEFRGAPNLISAPRGETINLIAEPFFFPVKTRSELEFGWRLSGNEITGDPDNKHLFSIDTRTQASSIVPISVNISTPTALLLSVTQTIRLLIQ